jgi:hypothetical protein
LEDGVSIPRKTRSVIDNLRFAPTRQPFVKDRDRPSMAYPLLEKRFGEAGAIGAPSAVINAIVDALHHKGVRHVDMPATPVAGLAGAARGPLTASSPRARQCKPFPALLRPHVETFAVHVTVDSMASRLSMAVLPK